MVEIRFLPASDPFPLLSSMHGWVNDYRQKAIDSAAPHGPSHDCLICADARAVLGYLPMEPVLAEAARFMREQDAGLIRIGADR